MNLLFKRMLYGTDVMLWLRNCERRELWRKVRLGKILKLRYEDKSLGQTRETTHHYLDLISFHVRHCDRKTLSGNCTSSVEKTMQIIQNLFNDNLASSKTIFLFQPMYAKIFSGENKLSSLSFSTRFIVNTWNWQCTMEYVNGQFY